jgi:amino acid transporter
LGFLAFVLSTVLSCKIFPTWVLNVLGCSYIVFGIMSLLMLVSLSSAVCTDNGGCTLGPGAILAIIAFFMYVGAGTSTFYLKKNLQTNQPAAPHILPEE